MIKPRFTVADIKKAIEQEKEKMIEAIIKRLQYIGEEFIKNCRNNNDFTDRTGNLRSSIGYVILRNGVQLEPGFTDKGKIIGLKAGKKLMEEIVSKVISEYPNSIVLIGVAGMYYAAAVESKGRDVITGSSLIAVNAMKKAISRIKQKAA